MGRGTEGKTESQRQREGDSRKHMEKSSREKVRDTVSDRRTVRAEIRCRGQIRKVNEGERDRRGGRSDSSQVYTHTSTTTCRWWTLELTHTSLSVSLQ